MRSLQIRRRPCAGILATLLMTGCASPGPSPAKTSNVAPAPTVAVVAAPLPLRRLTNEEYNNSVRDLLGDKSRPANAFPADEVIGGFETNTVAPVTQVLVERYMDSAIAIAARAVEHLDEIVPCPLGSPPESCASAFIVKFGRLAFRRPLDDDERTTLMSIYTEKEKRAGHARAVELVIATILQSPKFLYRLEPADGAIKTRRLSGYELATRLSYFIWASTPDQTLLDAAAAGQLDTPADVERAARRLLAAPRAHDGIRNFHRQWLDLRVLDTASKTPVLYPMFSPELKAAMAEETLRFTSRAVFDGGDTIATLLTSRRTFVNPTLAKIYGLPVPSGDGFSQVDLPPLQRAGLLTQASVMTILASAEDTSPILRGKFVREKLLCERIEPPPSNLVFSLPPFDAMKTKRERFAQHRAHPSCASCHTTLDPVGFGFEHYDAVGAWRATEGALPIDAKGTLLGTEDVNGPFDGAVELAARLAKSDQVRRCVVKQWFRAALGRVEQPEDAQSIETVYQAFAHAGFDVRELIIAMTKSDAFRHAGFAQGGTP